MNYNQKMEDLLGSCNTCQETINTLQRQQGQIKEAIQGIIDLQNEEILFNPEYKNQTQRGNQLSLALAEHQNYQTLKAQLSEIEWEIAKQKTKKEFFELQLKNLHYELNFEIAEMHLKAKEVELETSKNQLTSAKIKGGLTELKQKLN